jgi:ABC-type uncharacterized transport system substrate-binding protein
MKRREFISLLGGAAAVWPLAAYAQQPRLPVIGFLNTQGPESFASFVESFRQGLGEHGFLEGSNVMIEYRWARGRPDQLLPMATELAERRVTVLVTTGGELAAFAAKQATSTIPHVFLVGSDPAEQGLVAAYNRPGGNITGVTLQTSGLDAKRLGLLRELLPNGAKIALLTNPDFPTAEKRKNEVIAAAHTTGHEIAVLAARDQGEINRAFKMLGDRRVDALVVSADPFFNSRREQIVTLAAHIAIPAVYEWREYAAAGGLMSYGPRLPEQYREVGRYTGRILKGEKPAEMPILLPTKFELVINLNTAKLLGLVLPPTLFAQADEVIE